MELGCARYCCWASSHAASSVESAVGESSEEPKENKMRTEIGVKGVESSGGAETDGGAGSRV